VTTNPVHSTPGRAAERTKATVLKTVPVSQFSAMPQAPGRRPRPHRRPGARPSPFAPVDRRDLVGLTTRTACLMVPREGGGLDVVAYIPGALLAIGAIVLVALAAYSIYWLIFRLGKGPQD
jgi:hypothetical protein